MKYRPEMDGLRALTVFLVILFHTGIQPFSKGFVGVYVFFVIRGYLITTIAKGTIFPRFKVMALRLGPSLMLMMW